MHTFALLDPNGLIIFFNLFFMKERVKKHLLSSTFSKTIVIESSINFNFFDDLSNYLINSYQRSHLRTWIAI